MDVDNLISGSSAFSKSNLNIWKFMAHALLKPGLENFEHYFASVWVAIVWKFEHFLALPIFGIGMKTDLFQSCGHCWVFQICWHTECASFTASSFRIWNSLTGIPSPPLALFIVMLFKAQLTYSRTSDSRWVITPSWLSESWRSFSWGETGKQVSIKAPNKGDNGKKKKAGIHNCGNTGIWYLFQAQRPQWQVAC